MVLQHIIFYCSLVNVLPPLIGDEIYAIDVATFTSSIVKENKQSLVNIALNLRQHIQLQLKVANSYTSAKVIYQATLSSSKVI